MSRTIDDMRELSPAGAAGSDPSFLLKALSEGMGELHRSFSGLPRRELLAPGRGVDQGWTLLAIPYHLREVEHGVLAQLEALLSARDAEIPHVDFDDMPWEDLYRDEDAGDLLEQFHYLRRHTSYVLWDLPAGAWERRGLHPFRGPISMLDIARELYQHDLEHLWQSQRMVEALAGTPR